MNRDEKGHFQPGNPGGPGRPPRTPPITDRTLADLAEPHSGPDLEILAMILADREQSLDWIHKNFPQGIRGRIDRLLALEGLATEVLLRRLAKMFADLADLPRQHLGQLRAPDAQPDYQPPPTDTGEQP